MKYINQLEPDGLIENFLTNPPNNFNAWLADSGVPVFSAKFDLLTSADSDFRQKIQKIPFYPKWSKLLQPNTCFVGTTVSEYALLTNTLPADLLATRIKQQYAKDFPFLIVKDIPQDSPLQNQQANDYAKTFIEALKDNGFIEIEGQALAWVPVDYENIDDYLSKLSASRRKDFRRKLKLREKVDINVLQGGDECFFEQAVLDTYYQLYLNVYEQSEVHFDLLTKAFFTQLLQDKQTVTKIFTYHHQGELVGYNICFIVNDMLVDKYIGLVYPAARDFNLYYISWFHNLEYAKQNELKYYIAGWTDPQVKASLGAKFTFTQHLVYIRNPLLRTILRKLSRRFESDRTWRDAHTDINKKEGNHG
ncbi:GNAT family N-acetyltransferase [Entomomonas asaccharolytica]|uniref:GNAT family N-acetyltransferase n=1 Tax=Entomomonas asaccharolytica TaxID=2785331 RepID=A0A974NCP8_9GAMM|nr:GNAT family N-acetyltransferase [Entomomonas asaccharolytica]QQP84311.1 GNAT family N-acetyltransferase [Entomomonas asaccharolytica]